MLLTETHFSLIANKKINSNMVSAMRGLQFAGDVVGLQRPHRLAMFLAQTAHESMGWQYDREIWGPTKAQLGYEGRKDLGNTQPGDGSLFRGYTPMQLTGRYNVTKFYEWCVDTFPNQKVPNFVKNPELMNTDPWEGIGPLWYWAFGKPASLNISADIGDFKENTRLINGGYKGINDRYRYYGRAGLILLGASPDGIKEFQRANDLVADGIVGTLNSDKTAKAIHKKLYALSDVRFTDKPTVVKSTYSFMDSVVSFFSSLFGR